MASKITQPSLYTNESLIISALARILITPGEPAGVGPDLILQMAQFNWPVELVAVCDPDLLYERAKQLAIPIQINLCHSDNLPTLNSVAQIKILPASLNTKVVAGKLDKTNSSYVIETLRSATQTCLQNKASAIVTGPVHKEIINDAGIAFSGHTEYFAAQSHVKKTVMLFVVHDEQRNLSLKVALATTHLPLSQVSQAITKHELTEIFTILAHDLQDKFGISQPKILVCGLNPHAGEGGYLGLEEIETIAPVIKELQQTGLDIRGPLAADTIFLPQFVRDADAIVAMYHDQALPLVKYIGFENAVNVTLGLPFIRTSVDHGIALDVAGTGNVKAGSMQAAIDLAITLVNTSRVS